MEKTNGINLRRNPYRGIIIEIAREFNVSEGSVRYGLRNKNPKVCELFTKKADERINAVKRFESLKESWRDE